MALDQETINAQLTLLATHRRTLAHLLQQAAQYGGEVFAPSQTANGIAEARASIARIKATLREGGVEVEDEPNDEAPPAVSLTHGGEPAGAGPRVQSTLNVTENTGTVIGANIGTQTINQPNWAVTGNVTNVAGDQQNVTTGGGDYAEGDIDKRQGPFIEGGAVYGDIIGQQTNYYQAPTSPLDRQQQRNRRAMLTKVKTIWIDGLLEQSLAKELRIALNLTEQADAVDVPLNALVQELRRAPRELPVGTPIINVFDQMGGALLILGAPGAGKTTLLLELARDLIARAQQDEGHPIPVVFNLSSWAEKRRSLREWLIEELSTKYDVPRKLAQEWVNTDALLPLFDGLDEVAADHRVACVETINAYQQEHGLVPLAVCSRVAEYEALITRLRLQGAIAVQPLTKQQVDEYLERAGDRLTGVRAALRADAELREMLNTPLMLSTVTLAYAEKSAAEVQAAGTPDEQRRHLFDAYILAMFQRRGKEARYPQQRTLRWLCWLAHRMTQQAQIVFLVEHLQPEWLPTREARLQYVLLDRFVGGLGVGLVGGLGAGLSAGLVYGPGAGLIFGLVFGLVTLFFGGQSGIETLQQRPIGRTIVDALFGGVVGGLIVGLVVGLVYGLGGGLDDGLSTGLSAGLAGGLLGGLLGVLTGRPGVSPRQVILVERLHWVWSQAWRSMASGLVGGLGIGLAGGLVYGLGSTLGAGLFYGLVFGVGFGLVVGLIGGWSSGPLTATIRVNQGIRRSARSALAGGLVGGLLGGLGEGLAVGLAGGLGVGLVYGLGAGLLGALGGALAFGGYACLSHLALRLVLYRNDSLPFRLVPFLDYCAERIFLRKVGGGYIFVHRPLMEHFASLYTEQPEKSRRV